MNPPKQTTGLQWNSPAWFGGQLGGTIWMVLIGATCFSFNKPITGSLVITIAILANLLGLILFINQHRIKPHSAMQSFILILAIATLLIFILLETANIPFVYKFGDYQSQPVPINHYWVLLLFPALLKCN